jgi:hypothetical protein
MKTKLIVTGLLVAMSVSVVANGGQDRGGGVSFVCKQKSILGSKTRVYLADSYDMRGSEVYGEIKKLKFSNPEKVLQDAIQLVRAKNEQVGDALALAIGQVRESLEGSLPLLGNDKIAEVPSGCAKEQLGIQDFDSGIVHVNETLRSKLSPVDQLLFKLHEGYLRVLWLADRDPNIQAVRDQVFTWAKDPQFVEFLQAHRLVEQRGACFIPISGFPSMCVYVEKNTCKQMCSGDMGGIQACGVFVGGPC